LNAERRWPLGLALVLFLTVAGNAFVYYEANRGDALAIEPDYYRKAVAWDSAQALEARSRALGWRVDAALSAPDAGRATFIALLADRDGVPLAGARVRVEVFAVARGGRREDTTLAETAPGRYALTLPVARAEWHEVRVVADRGADRFARRLRCLPGSPCIAP
jgi:hypothetical protein